MRLGVIIQTADGQHGRLQIQGWFRIRRKKDTVLFRMLERLQMCVKRVFYVLHRAVHLHQRAVRMSVRER